MQLSFNALGWLQIILQERFGQNFTLSYRNHNLEMHLDNHPGEIIFSKPSSVFFEASADAPCASWDAASEGFVSVLGYNIPAPYISDLPSPLISFNSEKQQASVGYDIIGLIYCMLNRIEEIGSTNLDNHGRFPATSSHAFKHDYLERPVVDEWLHVLGQVIQKVWPQLVLKQHQFSMKVSHDVDCPSLYSFKPWKTIFRMMAGNLLKRYDIKAFLQAPFIKLTTGKRLHDQDPYSTFDWLMDISEAHNLSSAFYFICGRTSNMDADYEPEHPIIRALMRRIHERGHEIGLHPSYGTYQKPELIMQEAQRLRGILAEENIKQSAIGGRMHYLRWEQAITLQAWNDAGMAYDCTLGYADRPGFRCGTCFEYPAFNPQTQQSLKIRIRPLIAMECTVIGSIYLGLSQPEQAMQKFIQLKDCCQNLNGIFTLLWHNSYLLNNKNYQNLYKNLLK